MKVYTWHSILRYKYVIALVIFTLVIGFVGDSSLVNRIAQKEKIANLEQQIKEERAIFERNKIELANLQKDPEIVKQVAHEEYYMKSSDEDVFVVEDE